MKGPSLHGMAQTVIAYVGMDENARARTTGIVWGSASPSEQVLSTGTRALASE